MKKTYSSHFCCNFWASPAGAGGPRDQHPLISELKHNIRLGLVSFLNYNGLYISELSFFDSTQMVKFIKHASFKTFHFTIRFLVLIQNEVSAKTVFFQLGTSCCSTRFILILNLVPEPVLSSGSTTTTC